MGVYEWVTNHFVYTGDRVVKETSNGEMQSEEPSTTQCLQEFLL